MKYRLLTFNIQHGYNYADKSGINLVPFADFIKKVNPDAVLLNEVRGDGPSAEYTDQTDALAHLLSWNAYFSKAFDVPGCGAYGNALLSPHPFNAKNFAVPEPEKKEACYEPRAVLRAEFQSFVIFGTHFGLSSAEQKNAVSLVTDLAQNERLPFAFMGDLNLTPDSELLSPLGECMTDTATRLPDPSAKTWPSDKPEVKIDYIYVSKNVKTISSSVLPNVISDHRPYLAEIEF